MKRLCWIAVAAVVAIGARVSAQSCLHWEKVSDTGPKARLSFGMVYDSARGVTVMNGGANVSFPPEQHHQGGTWEWDGKAWTLRTMDGPIARHSHDLCYDSARGRSVTFADRHHDPDTWEWDGTEWFYRGTGGPPNRGWAGLAYDAARADSVLFGGYTPEFVLLGDTWTWDGRVWVQQFPAHTPSPRANPAMAYDSLRKVVVLVAGESIEGYQSDVWQWDGTDWKQMNVPGLPKRANHGMAYDSARRRMVVFGGLVNGNTFLGDTWELVANCADCDGSGSLDIDDFVCFQTLFGAGDDAADCDQSGGLDIDDFVCFQTAFGVGCP